MKLNPKYFRVVRLAIKPPAASIIPITNTEYNRTLNLFGIYISDSSLAKAIPKIKSTVILINNIKF